MPSREQLVRSALRLEYATLAWNIGEAFVAVGAGLAAGSVALVGFGLDSVVECFSGAALVWRLRRDHDPVHREASERRALKLVGASFVVLAVYVAWEAISTLYHREHPEHSTVGIVLTALSVVVMPLLARAKRRVAAAMNSGALHADSRQTDFCAYLSAITLAGLLLNAILGWWWADPVAALALTPIIGREGVEALRGRACGCATELAADDKCCTGGEQCHE